MKNPEEPQHAAAMAQLLQLGGRSLASLTLGQLDILRDAGFDVSARAVEERVRRENAPRGAAQLRLAARDGELTSYGRAIVKVQAHNAAKARRSA